MMEHKPKINFLIFNKTTWKNFTKILSTGQSVPPEHTVPKYPLHSNQNQFQEIVSTRTHGDFKFSKAFYIMI